MAAIGMIAILAGVFGFLISRNIVSEDKSFRNGSVFLALGGMVGGVFATPSRGFPNGLLGARILCFALIAVGAFMIVKSFKKQNGSQEKNKNQKTNPNIPLFIAAGIFLVLLVIAYVTSGGSSSANEPWRDLAVSKKEYMYVYNYFKYGNP